MASETWCRWRKRSGAHASSAGTPRPARACGAPPSSDLCSGSWSTRSPTHSARVIRPTTRAATSRRARPGAVRWWMSRARSCTPTESGARSSDRGLATRTLALGVAYPTSNAIVRPGPQRSQAHLFGDDRSYPHHVSLVEQVRTDMTTAMKAREADRVGALRLLLSELQKAAKEGSPDELAVL